MLRGRRATAALVVGILTVLSVGAWGAQAAIFDRPHHRHHRPIPRPTPTVTRTATTPPSTPTAAPTTATPTATRTTPAPTPTGSGGSKPSRSKNCAPAPGDCGFPDAKSAGVPAAARLTKVPGQATSGPGWVWEKDYLRVNGNGARLTGLDVSGSVEVYGSDVTISNSRITATGESWGIGLRHANRVTIERTTITSPNATGPARLSVSIKDIYGDTTGTQIIGSDLSRMSTGIQVANGVFRDNYLHDFGFTQGDHLNGISIGGGDTKKLVVSHNTILNNYDQTDAIALFQDFGAEANKTIDNNLIGGGSYTFYGGGPGSDCSSPTAFKCDPSSNIVVTNNRFAQLHFKEAGVFGPVAYFNKRGKGNVFSGNVWDSSGAALAAP
jgi:parallel beta helix pectate lyase-like protein